MSIYSMDGGWNNKEAAIFLDGHWNAFESSPDAKCPVDPDTPVEVKMARGDTLVGFAKHFFWNMEKGNRGSLIAWRVSKLETATGSQVDTEQSVKLEADSKTELAVTDEVIKQIFTRMVPLIEAYMRNAVSEVPETQAEPVQEVAWPQIGDDVWGVSPTMQPEKARFDGHALHCTALVMGLLFPTEAHCQRFINARKCEYEARKLPGAITPSKLQRSAYFIAYDYEGDGGLSLETIDCGCANYAASQGVFGVAFESQDAANAAIEHFDAEDMRDWVHDLINAPIVGGE